MIGSPFSYSYGWSEMYAPYSGRSSLRTVTYTVRIFLSKCYLKSLAKMPATIRLQQ